MFTSYCQVKCDSVEKWHSYRLFNVTTYRFSSVQNMPPGMCRVCLVIGCINTFIFCDRLFLQRNGRHGRVVMIILNKSYRLP